MADPRHYGVSGPISTDGPSTKDTELRDALIKELKAEKSFETAEGQQRRTDVLKKFGRLTKSFVMMVGRRKGLPQSILETAGGKIFTFGSFRLGVFGPGSDIDTLMVAPKHVMRSDFFNYFPDFLRQNSGPNDIEEMVPVEEATVPIIKLEYCGVSVDLIFVSLQQASIPRDLDLTNTDLMKGLSEIDWRSVNGTRVTDRILTLVPESRTFRIALRTIKLWAQRRAIYGNVVGFPGGVAYAMMVARVCQLFPKAEASRIVWKFFWFIKSWQWPKPLMLQRREEGNFQQREFNPDANPGDRYALMPIITPAYPAMNSTYNITMSTKKVLMSELARGESIMDNIYNSDGEWKDLFKRHAFFSQAYKHYITIISASKSKEAQSAWSGLVQSRLRFLVTGIENAAPSVDIAQPYNKGFDRIFECKNEEQRDKTLQGDLSCQIQGTETQTTEQAGDIKVEAAAQADAQGQPVPSTEDGDGASDEWPQKIYTTTYYVGLGLKPDAKALNISWPIQEFKRRCTEAPPDRVNLYNENIHSIRVVHVRNYDLPADLFAEGETRPTKPKKNKQAKAAASSAPQSNGAPVANTPTTNGTSAASKKRDQSSADLDENNNLPKRQQSIQGQTSATLAPPVVNGNVSTNGTPAASTPVVSTTPVSTTATPPAQAPTPQAQPGPTMHEFQQGDVAPAQQAAPYIPPRVSSLPGLSRPG